MSETTIAPSRLLRGPLRPLRIRQYRLLVGSVTLAVLAAGVWLVALVWQVIQLGGGAPQLSVVATASAVGIIATSLFGGVLADRIPGRHILLAVTGVRTIAIGVVAVLALTGALRLWQLVVVALVIGVGNGFTYPAYSALLPAVLPERDLMAANGLEQTMRPTVMQAAGPALASTVIAASSPAAALAVVAAVELAGIGCLVVMRHVPLRRSLDAEQGHGARAVVRDLRDGFTYMARTPWLLATLLFASMLVLLVIGPIEVLLPFVVKDRAGGGPGAHAIVLGAFGVGGALGSLVMGSLKMPRRYLTVMVAMWGVACVPLTIVGVARDVWLVVVAVFVVGVLFNAPIVIWGTLLQRRVPPELLGRVSSLDFFVSLAFMPMSMAVAGPVSMVIGLGATFVIAGLVPPVLAVAAILVARLPHDERTHPLDDTAPEPVVLPQREPAAADLPDCCPELAA
ncbi:MAG: MFS transporter [Streptosporangiales bacterium]|nr:MFS transporter [Streptosporangiales bacterium]